MKDYYARNRNFIGQSLAEMGIPCVEPGGAFYAFPYVGALGFTSEQFALELLQKEKVAVVPGTAFGACGEGYVRCSFATSLEDLKEALSRMANFVSSLREP
jgi:aminotransferase